MAADQRTLRVVVVGNANSAQRALGDLGDSAASARRDADNLGDALNAAGDDAGQLGEGANQAGGQMDAMGGKVGALKGAMVALGAAVIAALPLAALAGFSAGLDRVGEKAKLAAQLGLTGADAAKAGKVAGDLYAQGWGESFADAGEAVKRVTQDIGVSMNSADFKPIANKVMALGDTFDQDLGGTTRAVGQMIKTGLAKDANEALDVIAAGMTKGVDKSEDFLDTLNEYGTQFRKLGLDGATATGLLSQGLKAGARDADLVADALKEFSIRAVDGSTTSAEGYKALGLEADKLTAQIAKGGPEASRGLDTVLTRLKAMKDPVKQNAAAVALFGTQSEDLGQALYSLDPSTAVAGLGKVKGAAQQMADTMSNNAAHKVEAFKRTVQNTFVEGFASIITAGSRLAGPLRTLFAGAGQSLAPFKAELGSVGKEFSGVFSAARPVLKSIGDVITGAVLPAYAALASAAMPVLRGLITAVTNGILPAYLAFIGTILPHFRTFANFIRTTIAPVLTSMFEKARPVIAQLGSTIGSVFAAVGAAVNVLVPILQVLWKLIGPTILTMVQGVWSGLMTVISGALNVIQGVLNVFVGIFTGNWSKAWNGVKQVFSGIWQVITGLFRTVISGGIIGFLRSALSRLQALWSTGWNALGSYLSSKLSGLKASFVNAMASLISRASGAVSSVKSFFVNGFNALALTVVKKLVSVVNAVKEIPGKAKSALLGLPGTLAGIGRDIIAGLVRGIRGSLDSVMSAAKAIVDKIPGPIKKALGIHSPSRVMAEIGKFITSGLVKGMLGGTKSIEKTSKKLADLVTKAFKAKSISRGKAKSLHKYISDQNKKLTGLSKKREDIGKRLAAANTKLADLKKAKSDMASSVTGKAKDYGSFMGAFDSSEYGDNSGNAILARLKTKLQGIVDFRSNLQALAKRGLGSGILSEIANAGPDEGGAMAQALLNADLGQIKQLNSTYSAIGSQSSKLGSFVSGNYYDAGIRATEGLVKGLKADEKKLTKQIESMAAAMVKTLKKKLGIKSPSRVFKGLGRFTSKGYAIGVNDGQGDVQAAVDELAATRPSASRSAASSAVTAAAGARSTNGIRDVIVNVRGNVTTEKDLAKAIATTVRDEIIRTGKRNGGRTGF